jgi:hypothetical protein
MGMLKHGFLMGLHSGYLQSGHNSNIEKSGNYRFQERVKKAFSLK